MRRWRARPSRGGSAATSTPLSSAESSACGSAIRSPRTAATSTGSSRRSRRTCTYEIVPTGQRWEGHAGARAIYAELFAAFPDNASALTDIVVGPQGVFEAARLTGTNLGPWAGAPASGLYADGESFTFMTPQGHALAAWITFSAFREGHNTIVQAQALERTSDPLIELSCLSGGNRLNDRFREATLANLARSLGVADPLVETTKVCVDRRRQWRYVGNVRHSPAISMAIGTMTAPVRWFRDRAVRRDGGAT